MQLKTLLLLTAVLGIPCGIASAQGDVQLTRQPMPMPAHFFPPPLPEDKARNWPCQDGQPRTEPGVDLAKARQDRTLGILNNWGQHHLKFSGRPGCSNWEATISAWQRMTAAPVTGVLTLADLARVAEERTRTEPQYQAVAQTWSPVVRAPEPPPDFEATDDPAATVFGLKLGHPVNVPACPAFLEPPKDRFVPQSCYSTFGSGDIVRPRPAGTMQIYFSRNEHPEWMGRAEQANATGYAPSVLADFRAKRVVSVRFVTDQKMRQVALDALTRKWGTPTQLSQDRRYATWTLPAVEVRASCPEPVNDPTVNPLGIVPPCNYSAWLRSAKAAVDQEQRGKAQQERERIIDTGRKL